MARPRGVRTRGVATASKTISEISICSQSIHIWCRARVERDEIDLANTFDQPHQRARVGKRSLTPLGITY
jgi:hypothetical protein